MELDDLNRKVNNEGATAQGKLPAEEWNFVVNSLINMSTLVRKVEVTEAQMQQMIANHSWEAGVTYYTVEE